MNNVLATVGGREITTKDLNNLLNSLDPQTARQFSSEQGRKRLIQELVNQELFYLDAIDSEIDKDDAFKAEFEKVKANFLKQYAVNKLMNGLEVSEQEVKEFYAANLEHFKNPPSVRASHILVDTEDKAAQILGEINEGLAFEDAAVKYSSCPSKEQGGDLGFFTKGRMVPEFELAAFDMEKDEVSSKPVKTQFGYHILKLVDKKAEEYKSFEEVKDQIAQQILSQKQENVYFGKINQLKDKYEIKVNE